MSKPYIIAISGASGSGKSTFVKRIVQACRKQKVTVLSQDHYYRDMSHVSPAQREAINYDHPQQLDNELLAQHLQALASGKTIAAPLYDFATHSRKTETLTVVPRRVIICEGIFCLYEEQLRKHFDLKIFLEVPLDICLLRRIRRDVRDRGRTMEQVTAQYLATVRPMYLEHVEPTKNFADFVLNDGRGYQHIERFISQLCV